MEEAAPATTGQGPRDEPASPTPQRLNPLGSILYAAGGDLAYGRPLHGLLAGSVFAGSTEAPGLGLADCGRLLLRRPGSSARVELYYVPLWLLSRLDSVLAQLGARREGLVIRHGRASARAEAHLAPPGCPPAGGAGGWARVLLVLPPAAPPPTQPMASYPAVVRGLEPSREGLRFVASGSTWRAAVVDVVAPPGLLEEWASGLGARLEPVTAELEPRGLLVYAYAPVVAGEGCGVGAEGQG